jgi:hypothetical protein
MPIKGKTLDIIRKINIIMLFRAQRQQIAKETQRLTPGIIGSTPGATADSTFYTELLPPLQQSKTKRDTRVHIENGDSFTVAQRLVAGGQTKVAVLNMASDRNPGGGWLRGALAQEEALCLRSTLAATLNDSHYPTPPIAATWSPRVVIFREEVVNNCQILEKSERFVVGVVSVAGLRRPPLTGDELDYRECTLPEDISVSNNLSYRIPKRHRVNEKQNPANPSCHGSQWSFMLCARRLGLWRFWQPS